jgi:SAM-dependent methyltransferase
MNMSQKELIAPPGRPPAGAGRGTIGGPATHRLTARLIRGLLPGFRSGHTRYVECVKGLFRDGCRWLDAGGGRRIFHDPYDGERDLVARAARVVACDADLASLEGHASVDDRIGCDLARIPLGSGTFDLITCGMVVEHLDDPASCLRELGRLLDRGGTLVVHTVNLHSYPTWLAILSRAVPFRRRVIAGITGRAEQDIFPTRYRCNTAGAIRELMAAAGLRVLRIDHLDSGPMFRSFPPLALLEMIYIRLTRPSALAGLRGQLLVVATREPGNPDR